jgi:hypothetical protein
MEEQQCFICYERDGVIIEHPLYACVLCGGCIEIILNNGLCDKPILVFFNKLKPNMGYSSGPCDWCSKNCPYVNFNVELCEKHSHGYDDNLPSI